MEAVRPRTAPGCPGADRQAAPAAETGAGGRGLLPSCRAVLRLFCGLAAFLVAFAAGAPARATVINGTDDQTAMYQQWVDAAAALVPVPSLPVQVVQQRCPTSSAWCVDRSLPARMWTAGSTSYMWKATPGDDPAAPGAAHAPTSPLEAAEDARDRAAAATLGAESPDVTANAFSRSDRLRVRLTFLHEIGHVFDLLDAGPKGYRRAFARIMGRPFAQAGPMRWDLEEQFAMGYAFCAVYPDYDAAAYARTVWWGYDYLPTADQYARVCNLLRHASEYDRYGYLPTDPPPYRVTGAELRISGHGLRQLHARLSSASRAPTVIVMPSATKVTAALNAGVVRLSGGLAVSGVRRARISGLRLDLATGRLRARVNGRPVVLGTLSKLFAVPPDSGATMATSAQELRFTARAARLLEAATGRPRIAHVAAFVRLQLVANS
jgi:hypothetical protein